AAGDRRALVGDADRADGAVAVLHAALDRHALSGEEVAVGAGAIGVLRARGRRRPHAGAADAHGGRRALDGGARIGERQALAAEAQLARRALGARRAARREGDAHAGHAGVAGRAGHRPAAPADVAGDAEAEEALIVRRTVRGALAHAA